MKESYSPVITFISIIIGALIGVTVGYILSPDQPPLTPTPTEYTKNGMTYIEFPRGSVANYTLDSMARESRVVLQYQQIVKPCE